jgi:hypothetical protein
MRATDEEVHRFWALVQDIPIESFVWIDESGDSMISETPGGPPWVLRCI